MQEWHYIFHDLITYTHISIPQLINVSLVKINGCPISQQHETSRLA